MEREQGNLPHTPIPVGDIGAVNPVIRGSTGWVDTSSGDPQKKFLQGAAGAAGASFPVPGPKNCQPVSRKLGLSITLLVEEGVSRTRTYLVRSQ